MKKTYIRVITVITAAAVMCMSTITSLAQESTAVDYELYEYIKEKFDGFEGIRHNTEEPSGEKDYDRYDYQTVVIKAEALPEEDMQHVTYANNGFYVLKFDTEEEAASVMDKYEGQASYDEYAELWDTGAEGYSYGSWGGDIIDTAEMRQAIIDKYGSLDRMRPITVGVVDSGVDYNYPGLAERISSKVYNFTRNNCDVMDDVDHGTGVAGIIADLTLPNVSINVYKVSWENPLTGKTSTPLSAITAGVDQAIADEVDIINLSLGISYSPFTPDKEMLQKSIAVARSKGIEVVVAAGNSKVNSADYFPANMESVITVSAINRNRVFDSGYSGWGTPIDVAAPGTALSVYSAGGGTRILNGTSFSSPHAAAAAALIMTYYDGNPAGGMEYYLRSSAMDAGDEGWDIYYGNGILNLSVKAKEPIIENASGGTEITIKAAETDSEIYYTLDGRDPVPGTKGTYLYEAPLNPEESCEIKAVSVNPVLEDSDIVSEKVYVGSSIIDSDFEIDDNGFITKCVSEQPEMVLPPVIGDVEIRGIAPLAFKDCSNTLTYIELPETVTSFGILAFGEAEGLRVRLAGDIEETGLYPFGR
ncbi:MAG: S8 family serine peptidase, partial [Parasporobacterium sp.]|nr:S8 family serine peptidase [Parasporobacterium sp.]